MSNAYEKAGVSITAGEEVVSALQEKIKATKRDEHLLGGIGSFAGCYQLLGNQLNQPVLVAGADGVGTKVILAGESNKVGTIGQDLVAMCVNDVAAQGALPLFFLDYLAVSKLDPKQIGEVLAGIVDVCRKYDIVLLGGETAEMPGVYQENMFDLAGFAVGLANKKDLLSEKEVKVGDYLIGLPSSGLHSNGFSLVRKILFADNDYHFEDQLPGSDQTIIDELLTPTKIYTQTLKPLLQSQLISGAAHITGGGLLENVPRMLNDKLKAVINLDAWTRLPIFDVLVKAGKLSQKDAYLTFNMGIGMVLAIHPTQIEQVKNILSQNDEMFFELGQVEKRQTQEKQVELIGGNNG